MRQTVLTLAFLLLSSAAGATAVYIAPEFVMAEGDGSFSFEVTLVAGEDCVGWTGYG